MYTNFRFTHSPNPRRTCSSLWGLLPAAIHCSSEETQAQGAPAYGFSREASNLDFMKLPYLYKTLFGPKSPH